MDQNGARSNKMPGRSSVIGNKLMADINLTQAKALLSRFISGELWVPDAEKFFEQIEVSP